MAIVNLGVLAHVDAGKTSLTERLLFEAGVIDQPGSVDEGSTQTDTLELERRRGITIKSAVASFLIDDVTINLIDTPGHPDFIAEVERVLAVLDGAVIVISAVEGVQAQTRVLFHTLKRLGIPILFFANKIDRRGARYASLISDISERLTDSIVAVSEVAGNGADAVSHPLTLADSEFRSGLVEALAERDEEALAEFVTGKRELSDSELTRRLAAQVAQGNLHPIFFGSAISGAGVGQLMRGIAHLLPTAAGNPDAELSGAIFKVERGPNGEKIAYARVYDGSLHVRERLRLDEDRGGKITAIQVFRNGGIQPATQIRIGEIGKVWGLKDVQIGDIIGEPRRSSQRHFSPPTLETLIAPVKSGERGMLLAALSQLAEQDPLINVRQDDQRQEIFISLYGEVQKEVIGDTLALDFGIEVEFRETTTICIERVNGTGAAFEVLRTPANPFLATIGLRVEPAPLGSGIGFKLEVELGSIPLAFHRAVEETVGKTLLQGLNGWSVTDCLVTMTHSGYLARQSHSHSTFDKSMSSTAGDFRLLTPLVLMEALRKAGTEVCEPINRFFIELPTDLVGSVISVLSRHGAIPYGPEIRSQTSTIEGMIPVAAVHGLQQMLPHLTRGEGLFDSSFDHYEPIRGTAPKRARTDNNPLDRDAYLIKVGRRI
jgi:ribosomal protection tetracycline resistance protein